MDIVVFAAVLVAALMHASWNAIVKTGLDRFSAILLMTLAQGGIGLVLIPAFPLPAAQAWPWVVASALLHMGYKLFLIRAYEHGELSQVYPVARGTAPLIVLLVGAAFLGEALGAAQTLAVLAIALGIMLMALRRQRIDRMPAKALGFALGTACFTAAYTLVDGIGARLAGTASGYTMWLFAGDAIGITAWALATRGRGAFGRLAPAWRSGVTAGALSLGAYWIVIWAFTLAPLALVAALRETSVLFAMLIGVFVLGERAGPIRWVSGALILAGVVLMRL
ncbi:MAG TPA: EamA family transporter [Thermohalobaculum sp.]|nr:EamA family transporter [Thermohalobaculum sp.]